MPVPRSNRLYAVALMLLFTLLGTNMAWASHDDAGSEVDPQLVAGNPQCSADTVEAKIESPSEGESISVEVDGQTATATILSLEREGTFSFKIQGALAAQVIVKGGPDANVYDYSVLDPGGIDHDDGLHAPENDNGKFYGISHISFCLVALPEISLSVDKTASPTSVPEPGGDVTFSVAVTNTSGTAFELTSLTDDIHGDLDGQGDCSVPQPLAGGETYSCSFEATVSGQAGDFETDTVTAVGTDDLGNTATDSDDATVTIEDVLPTISVDKSASPSTVSEPSGDVTFTAQVTNDSPEEVTLTSLSDDTFGTLAGDEDCQVGTQLAAGDSCSFDFQGEVSGNAGDTHTNVATATAEDDEGNTARDSDDATVTIEDVLPTISVDKDANPSTVSEPGGDVTFTAQVTNDSPEGVTLTSLSDDTFGTLAGDEDCQVGTQLAAGDSCSFDFVGAVSGNAGDTHTNVATATADDDEGNTARDSDDAVVTIMALSQVTPTDTECDDYMGFTADNLSLVQYSVKDGLINQTNPGVFFYYTKVIAPSSSFTVDLQQTVDEGGFPAFDVLNDQVKLYDANCNTLSIGNVSIDGGQASIDISGATEGELIVVSVKYDTGSVVGAEAPSSDVHYDFATLVDGTVTTRDVDGVDLQEK